MAADPAAASVPADDSPEFYEGTLMDGLEDESALTHYMQVVSRYRDALILCATIAGADASGGVPTFPSVDVWAVQEVTQLRKDYAELLNGE